MNTFRFSNIVISAAFFLAAGIHAAEDADLRSARYTLHALKPLADQVDLLAAVIETKFPDRIDTIGNAVDYILMRSGYRHIATPEISKSLLLPLPRSHRKIGPIDVRSALQTILGNSWSLKEDKQRRIVWFQLAGAPPDENIVQLAPTEPSNVNIEKYSGVTSIFLDHEWRLDDSISLQENFRVWTKSINWSLEWNSQHDYDIKHTTSFFGTLPDAVSNVLEHYRDAPIPLVALFFNGNKVLLIEPQSQSKR